VIVLQDLLKKNGTALPYYTIWEKGTQLVRSLFGKRCETLSWWLPVCTSVRKGSVQNGRRKRGLVGFLCVEQEQNVREYIFV